MVMVTVPDGVYEGHEFTLEYEGTQLVVCCPDGCGPGSDIELEVPVATGEAAPNLVDVVVPDGCYSGDEFVVEFDGTSFNITVPEGSNPGETITIEVPAAEPSAPTRQPSPPPKQKPKPKIEKMNLQEIPDFKGAAGGGGSQRDKPSKSFLEGLDIPAYRGPMKGVTKNSVNANAKWGPATSLFDMNPDQGYGRPAGDFQVGQLVQVMRSNGSWTYGKVMDFDPEGCTYSVMTKAGAKHFVERDDITVEIVENPGGGCAQQ